MKTDTKELRKEVADKGITTIVELSEKTGINRVTLGKILCGDIQPSADTMYKLAELLDMDSEKAGENFLQITFLLSKFWA